MSDICQITYDVRPYEAGYQKSLQPEALLNYFQDAAFKHSLSRGFSAFHLLKKGLTWVLSRYHASSSDKPASSSALIGVWKSGNAWRISRGFFCQYSSKNCCVVSPSGQVMRSALGASISGVSPRCHAPMIQPSRYSWQALTQLIVFCRPRVCRA